NSATAILWLTQEGKGWVQVFPCATPETLQQFKSNLPEITANEEKTKALVEGLRDPLRAELISMLQQGKSASAATRYAEATKPERCMERWVMKKIEYRLERNSKFK